MSDKMPLWARFMRLLGFHVEQEFLVMTYDHQKAVIVWTSGMPTFADAKDAAMRRPALWGQPLWVRRHITIWKDFL